MLTIDDNRTTGKKEEQVHGRHCSRGTYEAITRKEEHIGRRTLKMGRPGRRRRPKIR